MQEKINNYQQKRKKYSQKNSRNGNAVPQNSRPMKEKTRNFPAKQNKIQTRQNLEICEKFLPLCREDMHLKGWNELDILLVSGDAYIDHPAFAAALLGRYLEHYGFKVGIITQPDWKDPAIIEKIQAMGRPQIGRAHV